MFSNHHAILLSLLFRDAHADSSLIPPERPLLMFVIAQASHHLSQLWLVSNAHASIRLASMVLAARTAHAVFLTLL